MPTRYPSVYLFDRVADESDFEALYALESLTNERIRDEVGQVELVPPQDRLMGPGSGPIMAAFTHLNPEGSRFSDGTYGVFYAAHDKDTAVAETQYHHALFLAATRQGPMQLPMRLYAVRISAQVHDLRSVDPHGQGVHALNSYAESQALGRQLRQEGSAGVVYRSVRHLGGECVGLFKPTGASQCVHAAHLLYVWDGARFADVYEKLSA
ncbi:MAG: RES domain-containing protein [Rubrivivax sp.]|nr:MAG: RES domain-containing protein [Rubrivivax sp.]